jgi:hypothetical protein
MGRKGAGCRGSVKIFGVLRLRSSQSARATSLRMTILGVLQNCRSLRYGAKARVAPHRTKNVRRGPRTPVEMTVLG